MKVEKLIGTQLSATFSDLKNSVRNHNFTHKITWSHTDYTPTDDALTAAVNASLAKNASDQAKGLLKGYVVRDVVAYTKTAFTGIANQASAVFDLGITGDTDKFIDSQSVATAGAWDAYTPQGDGDGYGFIATTDVILSGTLTATVSSGAEKLDKLTAGEIEVYMEIVDMNELLKEGAWATVTL
tara:strand:+ start:226 stop:777 length:552 start_codon:yes stop_codon:yes gene_type:complete